MIVGEDGASWPPCVRTRQYGGTGSGQPLGTDRGCQVLRPGTPTSLAGGCPLPGMRQQYRGPGDGFCEIHVNTIEGTWSLLRSWLRPHRGISQEKLPLYLGFFEFVHNARRRGKALLGALVAALVL